MNSATDKTGRTARWLADLRRWAPALVFGVGLALTALAWSRERWARGTMHAQEFQERATNSARMFEEQLRDTQQLLRGALAFVESSHEITEAEWARFVDTVQQPLAQYGVERLAWFERRPDAHAGFTYLGVLCAPAERCDGVVGLDNSGIDARREAMERAAGTGLIAMSAAERVDSAEARPRAVFSMYVPVYRADAASADLDSTRGWVASSVRVDELLAKVEAHSRGLELHLYDRSSGERDGPYDVCCDEWRQGTVDAPLVETDTSRGRWRATIYFGGRDLALTIRATGLCPASLAEVEALPTGFIGGLMSAMMALWARASARTRERAEGLAASMTESLRRSERRYELVARASAAGIWEWDLATDQLHFSQALIEMTGIDTRRTPITTDSTIDLIVHPEDRERLRSMLRAHIDHGTPFDLMVRLRNATGQLRWMHCNGLAQRDDSGTATLMAGSVIDVHEQRLAEERLERHATDLLEANEVLEAQARELAFKSAEVESARAAADAANRAKSDFLAHLSHEIRTPMTAILGFADVLAEESRASPKLAQWLEHLLTIRRNGEHLLGLLNDVLDMSKIEAGRMTVERIACSPASVARDVVSMLGERAACKGLALRVESEPGLPAAIVTDPLRLRQILTNLVGNAIKFTERGSVTLRIAPDDGGRVAFEVIDTGIGLTSEQLSRLFLPFEQAEASTGRRYGGTGLGLAISRRLAELLGGDIETYSTPGEGSRFILTILAPVAGEVAAPRADDRAEAPRPVESALTLTSIRVLLAEDGPDNQRLISFHLRKAGAEVEIVRDGRQALERTLAADRSGQPYDVVLMDIQMPEMDGFEATRQLRRAGYGGPIIALTASAMIGDRERCIDAGCDDYAAKPINKDSLLAVCARWAHRTVRRAA